MKTSEREFQVEESKQNPIPQTIFRAHDAQPQQQSPSKVPTNSGSGSNSTTVIPPRRRNSGNVIYDYLPNSQQAYAPAAKLRSSDFRPRLCEEFPGDVCPYSPVPCGWPANPPNAKAYGKPNRTPQEYGTGWPKECCDKACGDRPWFQRIYVHPKQHPAGIPAWNILAKHVHPRLPYGKNVGDILPRLTLRQSDVIILPCVDRNDVTRAGYVAFVKNNTKFDLEPGTMLLRLAKSFHGGFRMRECIKLFLRTVDGCWRFKGTLDTHNVYNKNCTPSNYVKIPVRYQQTKRPNTADSRYNPQRGDILIHEPWKELTHTDRADKSSSLRWWLPTSVIDLNDILVRMCVWTNDAEGTQLDAFVDLFMFNGMGLGWVFLGRDETTFDFTGLSQESDTSDDDKVRER